MKLVHLEPQFVQYFEDETGKYLRHVPDLAHSQGIVFLCPACFAKNNGPVGTHGIEVSFHGRGVLDHQGSHNTAGNSSRWQVSGNGYSDLSLHPSIDCGCWHGFIKNGDVDKA